MPNRWDTEIKMQSQNVSMYECGMLNVHDTRTGDNEELMEELTTLKSVDCFLMEISLRTLTRDRIEHCGGTDSSLKRDRLSTFIYQF